MGHPPAWFVRCVKQWKIETTATMRCRFGEKPWAIPDRHMRVGCKWLSCARQTTGINIDFPIFSSVFHRDFEE